MAQIRYSQKNIEYRYIESQKHQQLIIDYLKKKTQSDVSINRSIARPYFSITCAKSRARNGSPSGGVATR